LIFLGHAAALLADQGWRIANIDVSVIAESPRIGPRVAEMQTAMGRSLGVDSAAINVKATTNEGLGSLGRGEGIACFATATLSR
jgi:2-C-methyl-D-erythritol 2,4-cyclodiphosphate synthase